MSLTVKVERLPHGEGLPLPSYHSEQAAGLDLQAAIPASEPLTIEPGMRALTPTGFAFELPPNHEAQVRPRSGLALRHGVTVLNSPGTIDADYRGEVRVLLINLGQQAFRMERGERIAQLVIRPVPQVTLTLVPRLDETGRGSGSFGSTG